MSCLSSRLASSRSRNSVISRALSPLGQGMPRAVWGSAAVGGDQVQVGMPLQEVSGGGERDDDPRPRVAFAAREADQLFDRLGSCAGELTEQLARRRRNSGGSRRGMVSTT